MDSMNSFAMTDIEFAALMVSRVCHDLVGPLGAVVNGLEVLEDERDATMRADALKLVTSSADQALARIQFMRIAFGAAGSAGAELDLGEVGRLVTGLLAGGRVALEWNVPRAYWGKDWAKLLMNATLLAADCLPRGGTVTVDAAGEGAPPGFRIRAVSPHARVPDDVVKTIRGEPTEAAPDARAIQPVLTSKLSGAVGANLAITASEGAVELTAGAI
jgi:histidine phosphotransferase ChpT